MQFNDNYIDFLNWMKDLYDAGALDPEFALGNADTSKWKAGNSVAYLCQWYNWNQSADLTSNRIFDKSCPDTYEAWCLKPVEGPKAYTVSPNYTDVIPVSQSVLLVLRRRLKRLWKYSMELMRHIQDIMILIKYGVEVVHYTLLEDGTRDNSTDPEMGEKCKKAMLADGIRYS